MRIIIFFLFLFFTQISFAWTCPNNFNIINPGDTLDQVEAQCGKPLSQTSHKSDTNTPQEWTYFVNVKSGPYQQSPNSIKMTATFIQNKLANLTVNGQSMVGTGICGAGIKIGDTQQTVKNACGQAVFIQKNPAQAMQDTQQITQWVYDGSPQITLIFENGQLTDRK